MYSRKLVLAALAGGVLITTTTLSAQGKNYPTVRPTTVGKSILTNGDFEKDSAIPAIPVRPSKFPEQFIPKNTSESFYEGGEANEEGGEANEEGDEPEGDNDGPGEDGPIPGIYGQILKYGKDNNIKYTEAEIAEFKTFVDQYIAYLKIATERPFGWYFAPKSVLTNNFRQVPEQNNTYIRLEGKFNETQQLLTYEPNDGFIPVNSKAQYLISFKYRGNYPLNKDNYPLKFNDIAYVSLTWKPKEGTTLRLNGKDLTMPGKSWSEDRNRSNTRITQNREGLNNTLMGVDFIKDDPLTWKEKYMVVEAPENAESVQLILKFPDKNEEVVNFRVDIDDISMTLIEGHEGESNLPKLVAPKTPTSKSLGTTYIQREFAVQWEKSADVDGYEVEVAEVNGTATQNPKTYTTTDTSYTFEEGITPGKTYQVRVRSTKGEAKSEYSAAFKVQTKALGEFTNEGIPFLSTVSEDGSAPQNLPLYFMELKNPKAKLTCFIDDQEVAPTNKILQFPSTGNHTLRIIVEEATDRIWELSYELNIK